jgi:hypothetical protein
MPTPLGWIIAFASTMLFPAIAWAEPSTQTLLLSLKIQLEPNEQLAGFQLGTHGVTVSSLCHKPEGWVVSYGVGDDAAGGAFLGGEAKSPENELDRAQLSALNKMYLVMLTGSPIKLEGIARVRDKKSGKTRDVPFPLTGFTVEAGSACGEDAKPS